MRFADELIREAISLNWERLNENWVRKQKLVSGDVGYLREFATISLNFGRCAGHTTYIKNNAMSNDLIVVYNQAFTKEFNQSQVYSINQLLRYCAMRGKRSVEKVWVDTASLIFKKQSDLHEFYHEVSALKPNQIIMLG